jgi:hypothetical protein
MSAEIERGIFQGRVLAELQAIRDRLAVLDDHSKRIGDLEKGQVQLKTWASVAGFLSATVVSLILKYAPFVPRA